MEQRTGLAPRAEDQGRIESLLASFFVDALATLPPKLVTDTARQWLGKASVPNAEMPETPFLLAGSLLLFTPSFTGSTPVDRFVHQRAMTADKDERTALEALRNARFRLLRPRSQAGRRLLAVDATNGENVSVRDLTGAMGTRVIAVRLAPMPEGDFTVLGRPLCLNQEATDIAFSFVREDKGLTNPQRCATAVFRYVVRHTDLIVDSDDEIAPESATPPPPPPPPRAEPGDRLDEIAFAFAELKPGQEPDSALLASARLDLTSQGNLVGAVARSVRWRRSRADLATGFERVALIIMETFQRRASAGSGDVSALASMEVDIEISVTKRTLPREALDLYRSLRMRVSAARSASPSADSEELARVLQRIQALRAKTVDRGCTEQEALAAARKVAALLDQYGLSLGEVELRDQPCEGIGIETARRRRMPVDDCASAIGVFCDCKVWREQTSDGTIRHVYFGLRADVEAAHYLYDVIEVTFRTETALFRLHEEADVALQRRRTAHSFQVGLASGINEKLRQLKNARNAAMRSTGRDLIPVKAGVIEDELEKLGMRFQSTPRRRRMVNREAYDAGKAAGRRFEPHAAVRDASEA